MEVLNISQYKQRYTCRQGRVKGFPPGIPYLFIYLLIDWIIDYIFFFWLVPSNPLPWKHVLLFRSVVEMQTFAQLSFFLLRFTLTIHCVYH